MRMQWRASAPRMTSRPKSIDNKTELQLIELPYPFTKGSYEELQELELRLQQFHLLLSPLAEPLIQLQQASDLTADDTW